MNHSRYKSHKKKKSKAPWVFFVLALGFFYAGFSFRREIFFLFARDQSVRAEKAKEKIISLWKADSLKEQDITDFQSLAVTYSEKDPVDPQPFHLIARSLYWNLPRIGIVFDTSSLVLNLGSDFSNLIGKTQLVEETLDQIFWNARMAESLSSSPFPDSENNRVLLFLAETHRGQKKPITLAKEYGIIDTGKLSAEFQSMYIWLLTFNMMQAGDANGLEKMIETTKLPEYRAGIHFSPREENFLKGMGKYYKKDFISSLALLRSTKTDKPDKITETSFLTEATIFHLQNLTQKGIDLIEEHYEKNGRSNPEIPILIKQMIKDRPTAKTKIDIGLEK